MSAIGAVSIYMCATISTGQQREKSEIDNLLAENKAIAQANASLNRTYQKIIATLDGQITAGDLSTKNLKNALIEAERAWIKWRDAEALLRAYAGGAEGGSALNEDLHSALMDLINERQKYLEGLKLSGN